MVCIRPCISLCERTRSANCVSISPPRSARACARRQRDEEKDDQDRRRERADRTGGLASVKHPAADLEGPVHSARHPAEFEHTMAQNMNEIC